MKPFFRSFALGLGGELTLRILTPHDFFTLPTEVNLSQLTMGDRSSSERKKKKEKGFELREQHSAPPHLTKLIEYIDSLSSHVKPGYLSFSLGQECYSIQLSVKDLLALFKRP